MKAEKIRPVPKYIVKRIKKADEMQNPKPIGTTRYFSYLTKNDGELVKVTVAVRHCRGKWYYKQVAVHGVHSDKCFVKDMAFYFIGGYITGWYSEGLTRYEKWYESKEWGWAEDKYFNPVAPVVNKEFIDKFSEYKYSAYSLCNMEIIRYLRTYEKYPQAEYLLKAGLSNLVSSKQILEKAGKDKKFRKYLYRNADEISKNYYYIQSILKAYRTSKSLRQVQDYEEAKKNLISSKYDDIKELFKSELNEYFDYIAKNNTSNSTYRDYLHACNYLGIDMTQKKNRFPHDFMRWHDIRIDEQRTKRAMEDEEKRKGLYEQFTEVAAKYTPLQRLGKGVFICIIAKSPAELIREGEVLHHCVGKMNYDQKFIREESLIFFIRSKETPDIPLVTVEYSLSQKKVLQCYADSDTRPSADIENFVYKEWLPYANRKLRKICA